MGASLSDAALQDIRARDSLDRDGPPLSDRVATEAWRQAHKDRAALLAELDAIRAVLTRVLPMLGSAPGVRLELRAILEDMGEGADSSRRRR